MLGFDDSPEAHDALRLAGALAQLGDAEIVAVKAYELPLFPLTVLDLTPEILPGVEALDSELRQQLPGLRLKTEAVASSSAARALHDTAESKDADMIVVGSSHRGPSGRVFPG